MKRALIVDDDLPGFFATFEVRPPTPHPWNAGTFGNSVMASATFSRGYS
jgi:hypothetical protein